MLLKNWILCYSKTEFCVQAVEGGGWREAMGGGGVEWGEGSKGANVRGIEGKQKGKR